MTMNMSGVLKRIPVSALIVSLSCSRPQPVVEIATHHWPEGSAVSLIRNGKVVARSSLFGDHVRMNAPKPGSYHVRVASPEALASVSPELEVGPGVTAYTLPLPVMRRRIGTTNLGLGFAAPGSDSVCMRVLETSPTALTSISLYLGVSDAAADIIRRAHEKGIEVLLRGEGRGRETKTVLTSMLALSDSAERYGADGIVIVSDDSGGYDRRVMATVRTLAAAVHERGMTLSLALVPGEEGRFHPRAFFDSIPAPECPDDLVLLCSAAGIEKDEIAPVSLSRIENSLIAVMDGRIPLSRITVEIALSAFAYRGNGTSNREGVSLVTGAIERILSEAGSGGAIRLGDGTLILGFRGVNYAWDDLAGITRKIAFLRTGEFARVRGVRIVWDGLGVKPDTEGLKSTAAVFDRGEAGGERRR